MLNNEASSQEEDDLFNHLRQDETLQQQYDLLVRIWNEKKDNIKDADNINTSDTISRIISRATIESGEAEIDSRRKRRLNRRKISFAAGLLMLVVAGAWYWTNNKSHKNSGVVVEETQQQTQETIVAQKGSRTRSLLSDGTTVWLNVGSTLNYVNDFNGATREVRLEGEAFFDVVKQANRPFIVHTSGIDIKVLGTAFNVKSYPEDKNVETTLYRGLVQVLREEEPGNKGIQLKPNQKLILPKQAAKEVIKLSEEKLVSTTGKSGGLIVTIDSTKKENERFETAWLYSRLEFRNNNFEALAKKLERWYNVAIVFTDEKVKELRFDGSFERETIEQAFKALQAASPFNYNIKNHEIFIGSSE